MTGGLSKCKSLLILSRRSTGQSLDQKRRKRRWIYLFVPMDEKGIQFLPHLPGTFKPGFGSRTHGTQYRIIQLDWYIRKNGRRGFCGYHLCHQAFRLRAVKLDSGEQLIQNHAHRIFIRPSIHSRRRQNLRSYVCSLLGENPGSCAMNPRRGLRHSEIHQLDMAITGYNDVLRADTPMNYPKGISIRVFHSMGVFQPGKHLANHVYRQCWWKS